jgi:type II secretory pathway component PulJ
MSRLREEGGFTLAELLVGAMLMILVMSASLGVLDNLRRLGTRTDKRVELQDKARQASRELARSLRNIAPAPDVPSVIERGEPYDLVFRAVDRPGASGSNVRNLRRVRYCLDASDPDRGRLLEQTQRWTSPTAPPIPSGTSCPSDSWDSSRLVADYLTNRSGGTDRPLWTYRQESTGELTTVRVNLFLNDNPSVRDHEIELQTGVYLRNQNRVPTALFTVVPTGFRHVLLNGSTSSDPEGDPLDYVWFANGVEVGRGLTFDYSAPSGGTYAFRLDVRDPSGLVGHSPTRTVVLP